MNWIANKVANLLKKDKDAGGQIYVGLAVMLISIDAMILFNFVQYRDTNIGTALFVAGIVYAAFVGVIMFKALKIVITNENNNDENNQ